MPSKLGSPYVTFEVRPSRGLLFPECLEAFFFCPSLPFLWQRPAAGRSTDSEGGKCWNNLSSPTTFLSLLLERLFFGQYSTRELVQAASEPSQAGTRPPWRCGVPFPSSLFLSFAGGGGGGGDRCVPLIFGVRSVPLPAPLPGLATGPPRAIGRIKRGGLVRNSPMTCVE